jgi:hypothetical protein
MSMNREQGQWQGSEYGKGAGARTGPEAWTGATAEWDHRQTAGAMTGRRSLAYMLWWQAAVLQIWDVFPG